MAERVAAEAGLEHIQTNPNRPLANSRFGFALLPNGKCVVCVSLFRQMKM